MLMKGIVAFDSVFGNTIRVGEAIAEELRNQGHEIEVIDLGKRVPWRAEADFAFIGSPTRNGRMTSRAKRFVKRLGKKHWSSRTVVLFDTVLRLPEKEKYRERMIKWTENGAAPRLKALAEERGLRTYPEVLRVEVTGIRGPLAPGSLDRAREFARSTISAIENTRSE
jgi:flavodoxin